nr:amino acid--tRNA ligase-related protein [Streptomyces sp. BE133]
MRWLRSARAGCGLSVRQISDPRAVPGPRERPDSPVRHPSPVTRHPLTGQSFHLKHSEEEHLRRMVVSIDRVFNLSKAIRAEQADDSHAIEFTMLQTAARDNGLEDGIGLVADLVQSTVQAAFATLTTPGADFTTIRTRPVEDAIAEALAVPEAPTGADLVAAARGWLKDRDLATDGTDWAVMEDFVKHAVEKPVTHPTVLRGFPRELRHIWNGSSSPRSTPTATTSPATVSTWCAD